VGGGGVGVEARVVGGGDVDAVVVGGPVEEGLLVVGGGAVCDAKTGNL
jgi:hypothetical protein